MDHLEISQTCLYDTIDYIIANRLLMSRPLQIMIEAFEL